MHCSLRKEESISRAWSEPRAHHVNSSPLGTSTFRRELGLDRVLVTLLAGVEVACESTDGNRIRDIREGESKTTKLNWWMWNCMGETWGVFTLGDIRE